MKYQGKSYISKVKLYPELTKRDFTLLPANIEKSVNAKSNLFWNTVRRDTLSKKELRTYTVIDSIGEKANFDRALTISSRLLKGRFPLKYVDLDITKIAQFNKYEGIRLGAGVYSNDQLLDNISIA